MRVRNYSKLFFRKIRKIKGKELENLQKKIFDIASCENLDHYKNLRMGLKLYKRVHVNSSFVILFYGDDGTVTFVDYDHHDRIY